LPDDARALPAASLTLILFDGGMHIGWRGLPASVSPVLVVGVVGILIGDA
jgi:NhaP-type Na+/H+ and K+/H+ antiporter